MAQLAKKYYTPEEYFALEERSDTRHEYFEGEIYAMAGGSFNHSQIQSNTIYTFRAARGTQPCRIQGSEIRVQVKENGLYTYADALVVCGDPVFAANRTDTITNPVVVVEVMSPDSRSYDRGDKFALYSDLSSIMDYILIDSERVYVEHRHRLEPTTWLWKRFTDMSAVLVIESLSAPISVAQLYEDVLFATAPTYSE